MKLASPLVRAVKAGGIRTPRSTSAPASAPFELGGSLSAAVAGAPRVGVGVEARSGVDAVGAAYDAAEEALSHGDPARG